MFQEQTQLDVKNLSRANGKTYDEVADEYEERAESLVAVTSQSMDYFSPYIVKNGSVLDVGCAVGVAVNDLTRRGLQVTGIDISPKMVRFARARNPKAIITQGSFFAMKTTKKFDALLLFAFIHLFPKNQESQLFEKISTLLKPGGVALVGTTESQESKEGWFEKKDFRKKVKRFRRFWTQDELSQTFREHRLKELAMKKFADPYGKVWMDFIVKKERTS